MITVIHIHIRTIMIEVSDPARIAQDSFSIIEQELNKLGYTAPAEQQAVLLRIIHSTADFEFAQLFHTSPNAIERCIEVLRAGCSVVTDVNMVRVGVNCSRLQALGSAVRCFVQDKRTIQVAKRKGISKSAAGMRTALQDGQLNNSIVLIGNAPTALFEILRIIKRGEAAPAAVIGVPVGFVNTVESKTALMAVDHVPWITCTGRKGGSSVAVAIINALLRLTSDEEQSAL